MFGLYKGMASPLYCLAGINAIVFGVQANINRRLFNPDSLWSHFLAGSIAGLSQSIICSPMELAKTRMQIQGQGESHVKFKHHRHTYEGPIDCIRKIHKTEGIRGVFRGFTLTCFRETPSFGVYFLSYEWLCKKFEPFDQSPLGAVATLVAGGMAGMCSWFSTYPIDVIKSRIQADMTGQYSGFFDCCKQSVKESGPMVFTRGLCSTLLRAFPVNAATFGTVAYVLRFFKDHGKGNNDGTYVMSDLEKQQGSKGVEKCQELREVDRYQETRWDPLSLPVRPNVTSQESYYSTNRAELLEVSGYTAKTSASLV